MRCKRTAADPGGQRIGFQFQPRQTINGEDVSERPWQHSKPDITTLKLQVWFWVGHKGSKRHPDQLARAKNWDEISERIHEVTGK